VSQNAQATELPRVLLVGAGGVGAPAALAFALSGEVSLTIVDDDVVELGNLHRQILFGDADVGLAKAPTLARALRERAPNLVVDAVEGRFLPDTAAELLASTTIVLDGTDNFASRFLIADACAQARVPVVHAAAVRLVATVLAVSASGQPCYRCVFEDLPEGPAPDCATAGVLGPVCGVAGAIGADWALALARGEDVGGQLASYDATTGALRTRRVKARGACALCGTRQLEGLPIERYVGAACGTRG